MGQQVVRLCMVVNGPFLIKFRCGHLFPAWCSVVRLAHIWRPLISPVAFPPPSGIFSQIYQKLEFPQMLQGETL